MIRSSSPLAARFLLDTSINVAAELRDGAARKGSERLSAQVNAVLGAIEVLAFEPPADAVYGEIRAALERSGTVIGGNDLLIAVQGLALRLTLVTGNERAFRRIVGLAVENWLRTPKNPPGAPQP